MNTVVPVHPLPTQARRRQIVTVYAAGLLTALTVFLLRLTGSFDAVFEAWRGPILATLALATAAILVGVAHLAFPDRLGLPRADAAYLDERQASRIAQANSLAYRWVVKVLLFGVVLFVFFGTSLPAFERLDGLQGVALLTLLFIPFLPTAILAWTEPDTAE